METPTVETNGEAKKPYTRPQLTCYGDIAELTQDYPGPGADGSSQSGPI